MASILVVGERISSVGLPVVRSLGGSVSSVGLMDVG